MKKIGIHELYNKDPEKADKLVWGRVSGPSRRGFLRNMGLASMQLVLGAKMVHAESFPAGLIPAAILDSNEPFSIPGKHPQMVVLNDRPINAETPPHLLDPKTTPADVFFVRNNGLPPARSEIRLAEWTLKIGGESAQNSKTYSLQELKSKFETVSLNLTLECGGNGRSEYNPPAKGNQWSTGAVGCAKWSGVRLKDVLNDVGIKSDAVYIGYYGADKHLSGDSSKEAISRGVPMDKAMQDESLIAWAMNDQDLPILNGYPLRLVFGGWPASCSGKWLQEIVIRDKVHDGTKMQGTAYRVPCDPVAPGTKVSDDDMCIIESMPVKSLITYPKTGAMVTSGQKIKIRGHAWAGERAVKVVMWSVDFGKTWHPCQLSNPVNKFAWQHFDAEISIEEKGYYEIWAKATDDIGISQPMIVPEWNPKGYLNNACHRIAFKVS
jgi:DMSO/TMAO reductase YedYZ molybdopterin-dependent catalytic subunit